MSMEYLSMITSFLITETVYSAIAFAKPYIFFYIQNAFL